MMLLTGATGKVGLFAARQLLAQGEKVRVLVRSAQKAESLERLGVEIEVGDLSDGGVVKTALASVSHAVLITSNSASQVTIETAFIDAAAAAGVQHLIKLSSMEATPRAQNPIHAGHWHIEQYLRRSPLAWTLVRPSFFMQNLLAGAAQIRSEGVLRLPFGQGRAVMTDARDVGIFVAAVACFPARNVSYDVTGPTLLSFDEAAATIAAVTGKKVRYVAQPLEEFREKIRQIFKDEWMTHAVSDLFREIAEGHVDEPTRTFVEVMGRPPRSLRDFVEANAAIFGGVSS